MTYLGFLIKRGSRLKECFGLIPQGHFLLENILLKKYLSLRDWFAHLPVDILLAVIGNDHSAGTESKKNRRSKESKSIYYRECKATQKRL